MSAILRFCGKYCFLESKFDDDLLSLNANHQCFAKENIHFSNQKSYFPY